MPIANLPWPDMVRPLARPFRLEKRRRAADVSILVMAATLPWSTSLFSVAVVVWAVIALSTVDFRAHFVNEVRRPESALPAALFVLALTGMAWSDAAWPERLSAAEQMLKLFAIPLVIYQSSRSDVGSRVFMTFLASCTVLMIASWAGWLDPRLAPRLPPLNGVPVKNYITQAQEFVLCGFGFAIVAYLQWTKGRRLLAALAALIGIAFIANLAFVISSRTALISLPILTICVLAVLGARTMRRQSLLILLAAAAIGLGALWTVSPTLQARVGSIVQEIGRYEEVKDLPTTGELELTSTGQRLLYWTKALRFIADAPLLGHGTGSIGLQFSKDSTGKTGAEALTIANPHNQILHAGIQWGALGMFLLAAMWLAHLRMFAAAGLAALIGLFVVIQNILGSLFNSHLADFVEGWIYVIGVGVAWGMARRAQ